mmetsp:Transcript_20511/g.30692  ORF Transcript_20511/g.30692 Transcript_20511/m.30692 type:complete len:656 (-) Transcript_20511:95-2062(-)
MSSMEYYGNHDPEKEPALVFHWIVASMMMAGTAGACTWTQSHLYSMHSKGIRLQMVGHPTETSMLLFSLYLWPVAQLLVNSTKAFLSCGLYLAWAHIFGPLAVSIHIYRTLRFMLRVAYAERTKFFIKHGTNSRKKIDEVEAKKLSYSLLVIRYLKPKTIIIASICVFLVGAGPMMFFEASNVRYMTGNYGNCSARSGTYCLVLWYLYCICIIYFLREFNLVDPFRILDKIKMETLTLTICFILFFIATLTDHLMGSAHFGLFNTELMMIVTLSFWYVESYKAYTETIKRCNELKNCEKINLQLSETLSDPILLHKFQFHLMNEWASENLQFYKSVVLFEVLATKKLKQLRVLERENKTATDTKEIREMRAKIEDKLSITALEIYLKYIEKYSPTQVNVPARVSATLDHFFSSEYMAEYREFAEGTFTTFSQGSTMSSSQVVRPIRSNTVHLNLEGKLASTGSQVEYPHDAESPNPFHDNKQSFSARSGFNSIKSTTLQQFIDRKAHHNRQPTEPTSGAVRKRLQEARARYKRNQQFCKAIGQLAESRLAVTRSPKENMSSLRLKTPSSISVNDRKNLGGSQGSEGSVSINSNTAPQISEELEKLMSIFDEAKAAIYDLMNNDSHVRFAKTDSVKKYLAERGGHLTQTVSIKIVK